MATDVSAPWPDLILAPGSTITVTLDDASAVITQLNVYGYSPSRREPDEEQPFTPLFVYASPT